MRVMMKAKIDNDKGTEALRSGRLPQLIQNLMAKTNPEAAYFGVDDGHRCAFLFFDMTDSSQMPVIGEPLFMELGASISITPVMTAEDLAKGLQSM